MKGYLYKERVCTLGNFTVIAAIYIGELLLSISSSDTINSYSACFFLFLLSLMLYRSCADDKKTYWEHCSRAFPVSAFKRIGARFVFTFAVLAIATLVLFVSAAAVDFVKYLLQTETDFSDWFGVFFSVEIIGYFLILFSLFLVSAGISVTVCCFSKTQTGLTFAMLPNLAALLISYIIPLSAFSFEYDKMYEAIFSLKFILPVFSASIILYLALCMVCVIKETVNKTKETKKITIATAVLFVLGSLLIGAGGYSLDKAGAFEKNPDKYNYIQGYQERQEELEAEKKADYEAIRPVVIRLLDEICGENLVNKKTGEVRAFFVENGYEKYLDDNAKDNIMVISYTTYSSSTRPEYPDVVSIHSGVSGGSVKTDNLSEKITEIKNSFAVGMTEKHAVDMIKSYGFCPEFIIDGIDGERVYRTYRIEFDILVGSEETSNPYSINFDVTDGKIHDVRIYEEY